MSEPQKSIEDHDVAIGIELARQRNNPSVRTAAKIGALGDQGPLYLIGVSIVVSGLAPGKPRLRRTGMFMLASVAAADAGKSLAKRCVHRSRPHVLLDQQHYESGMGGSPHKPDQSFPSGHVAGCVAASRAVARHYPHSTPWTLAGCAVIAAARMAKGAHWPGDVVAGVVIGLLAESLSSKVLSRCFG
jgi:membrane-associated phospholipid phosphatase